MAEQLPLPFDAPLSASVRLRADFEGRIVGSASLGPPPPDNPPMDAMAVAAWGAMLREVLAIILAALRERIMQARRLPSPARHA